MDSRLFVWLLVILHSFVNLSSADPHDILQKALLNNSHELCLEKVSVAITTKPEYQFHEVSGESLQFKVRAANDAHIALTTGPAESKRMYEIIIGGWKNTESVIRKNKKTKKCEKTKNIMSDKKLIAFWIRWNGSVIAVGKEDEAKPFMTWEDPELPDNFITHYGISTGWYQKYITGEWELKAITTNPEYEYHEVSGDSLQFKVRAANDAHIALTTGPRHMYEIIIGGWNNTESVIRKNGQMQKRVETKNIMSDKKLIAFWIRWNGSVIAVGKEDEAKPFMTWEDPELPDNFITHYGISTGWYQKYVTGEWELKARTTDYRYQFHKSGSGSMNHVSGESLQFKVKAADDAHIALTTEPAEIELIYEVHVPGVPTVFSE